MSKYRFKTKKEFIRDGLWDEEYNCPDKWNSDGEMNNYLGIDVPDEYTVYCDKNEEFKYDGWLFLNTDYVIKKQQEYFDDLSQHIGRYIRALVDNPHLGSGVKKGDVGKIFSSSKVDFPNSKNYSCSNALSEGTLGIRYELLPEDYSPEQEVKEPNIEFIPGKWYKLINCENAYRKCSKIPVENKLSYSELIGNSGYRCETGSSGDLTRIKLVEDLSEIQEYLPDGHSDKIINQKFEFGKWYKWYQKNHGSYHYGKVNGIDIYTDTLVMSPWILGCTDYNYSGTFDKSKVEQIQEISAEEVQEFLPLDHPDKFCETCNGEGETMIAKLYPSGHTEVIDTCPDCNGTGFSNNPDKIQSNEFKKGEYIVITDKFDSYSKDFVSNHIYKQRKDSTYLQPEYDSLDSITNGWVKYKPEYPNWKYATQEEIDEYERRGKPYDVTELQKKELSMEEIQEECKKRFPIGCTYISINGMTYVLKDGSDTYRIFGNSIWAHIRGGFLFQNGKWAELISLPEESITEVPEYIEAIDSFSDYFIQGKIYKVKNSNDLTFAVLNCNDLVNFNEYDNLYVNLIKYRWKPSTKEAYEQQKTWLGIPEKVSSRYIMGYDPYEERLGNIYIHDEVGQYPSTFSDYWKNVSIFVEKEFDIYGPTPDIE
jgi:hypothetical protein